MSSSHHHHTHHHTHSHHHPHEPNDLNKAFGMGIILNLLFVIIEFYYGFKIDSLALMADASHNLSDVAGLLLGWIGLTLSRKKGNFKFSYGWKKASLFAAFINSTLILVGMGSLSWEALGRFQSQDQNPEPITIMIVAGVGLLINSFTAYLFFKGSKADLNIRGAFLHMTADAVVSLGVLVAGFLTLKFGFSWIDPVTSLIIAFVITIGSFRLFKQSLHLLMDGVPDSIDYESVKKYLMAKPGVTDVFDLHIWSLSSTDIALTAHLQMPGGCPGDFFLLEIKKELTDNFHIHHTTIQITRSFSLANSCIQT